MSVKPNEAGCRRLQESKRPNPLIVFSSTLRVMVSVLLAMLAISHAQSKCRLSDRERLSKPAEPRNSNLDPEDPLPGSDAWLKPIGGTDGARPLGHTSNRTSAWYNCATCPPRFVATASRQAANAARPREDSKSESSPRQRFNKAGLNENSFYKNKLEFSLDGGWLPINIPFVFDVFLGDGYTRAPLNYTLVPFIASLRWQMDNVSGPWIFRGNWDLTTSAAVTLIPRGPENHYFAWIMGIRRNFVPRRGRIAPYFDGRLGMGGIDAKGPAGVLYAQGQDFTFTVNMGSGVRYGINSRYSISAGLNWMHISNLYLSQPQFANYGINVYGPMFGLNVRLGKGRHNGSD